jgi:DMSO/TMAO reductase YedYZ molybdopterin-dependent catalytic subunit
MTTSGDHPAARVPDPLMAAAPGAKGPGEEKGSVARWHWRSPVRGPWLTSVFGAVLLVGIPIEFVTGLVSYAAYNPRLRGNDTTPNHGILGFYLFSWVTSPSWIYRVSQGVHVLLGLALVPVVGAKLWSVIPKLFAWPPLRSAAEALERISLLFLVGGIVFQLATGILNIDYDYSFRFSFYNGHLYGAWVFIAGFAVHVALRLGRMVRALRSRSLRGELATGLAATRPEPLDPDGLVASNPDPPTISRRGVLALVGGSALAVIALTAGESIGGGTVRSTALLAPRGRSYGSGPNDFPVNQTAATFGVGRAATDPGWQLEVVGARTIRLRREELAAMEQVTADLPIACVEGWSTLQRWTGVPLADLARRAGVTRPTGAYVESLERGGAFGQASLSGDQVRARRALLALRVNGADLSLDHGFPARVIVPAAPGVHNTKWVRRITFASGA